MKRSFLVLAFAAALSGPAFAQTPGPTEPLTIVSGDKTHAFKVELADTEEKRKTGLMNRASLPADGGMIFDFRQSKTDATIWMKNTKIPLDVLFIGADGAVVALAVNARPESLRTISPGLPAAAVLEINGGKATELGIKPGDKVKNRMFGNGG